MMALSLTTFVSGTLIKAAEVNANFSALNIELFDIDQNNFNAGTQLPNGYLAQITAANKVSGTSIVAASIDAVRGQIIFYIPGTLATGTNLSFIFRAPVALTITGEYLEVKTAPTGADLTVDINKNGATCYSVTKPKITAGNTTAIDSGVKTTTAIAVNDSITVDIDTVGSGTPGADLTVSLRVKQLVPA